MVNLARTPKLRIFWNFAKGGPRKNREKSRSNLGALNTLWRKTRYLLISTRLKGKHRETFWRKRRQAMANLARTPKWRIFWDFAKGGPRENGQKSRSTLGAPNTPRRKMRYLLISMGLECKHKKVFWRKWLFRSTQCRAMANLASTPKSRIFWDFAKGAPRENVPEKKVKFRGSKHTPTEI